MVFKNSLMRKFFCIEHALDGIAVGVAWTSGIGAGLGTTIAIMMHEIPHELGDFVLYKKLGLSSRGALGLNVIAALISYGGLYLGLGRILSSKIRPYQ